MPSMKEVTELPEIKALVYGESKTGKSTFASSFPDPGFIFLLEPDKSQYAGKDFDYEEYPAAKADSFDRIREKIDELQEIPADEFPYKVIIVDSLTEYAAMCEQRILKMNRREIDFTGKKMYNDRDQGMRIQDWGVFKGMIEGFVRNLHALPCHTIMVAHEYVKEAGDNKVLKGCLSISGNFGETGAKLFNTVLRSRAETKGGNTSYFLQTKPEKLFTAGVWGLDFDAHWENATFAELEKSFKSWARSKK